MEKLLSRTVNFYSARLGGEPGVSADGSRVGGRRGGTRESPDPVRLLDDAAANPDPVCGQKP